jgi:uncharacterized protein (DUF1810 family)
MSKDSKALAKAFKTVPNLTDAQAYMACSLLAINGLECALEFVKKLKEQQERR